MSERIATVQDLIAARQARGFAPEDVMRQLKLHPRQLHALEAGDWHALPGQAFVRGVLRGYGRMLEVDVEPLVEAMSATLHAADLRPAASLDEPLPSRSMLGFGSGGSGSRVAWILLLAAGVLVLAFFFGGSDLGGVGSWLSRENAVETAPGPQPEASAERGAPGTTTEAISLGQLASEQPGSSAGQGAPAAEPGPPALAGPTESTGPSAPAAPAPSGQAAGTATADASAASAADAARPGDASPSGPVLRLSFEREAWLEARRDGKVLVSGNQPAGSTRELPIDGTTALVIGNAAAVRAEFAGRPLDLTPHVRGSVARLNLP